MNIHQAFNRPAPSQTTTCHGNDLAHVCAEIRARGGFIDRMDVIGVAQYKLSYFESDKPKTEKAKP